MTWLLIVSGVFLIIFGLRGRYQSYQAQVPGKIEDKRTETKEFLEQNLNQQEMRLIKLNHNLDKTIEELAKKEREIEKLVSKIKVNNDQLVAIKDNSQEMKELDFKNLLRETYFEEKGSPLPDKYNDVFILAGKGLSSEEIAQELDLGIREIKLILRLYRKEADSIVE